MNKQAFAIAFCVLAFASTSQSHAQSVEDFYRGKTVNILVGFSAGGGYDLYARMVARYMGRHIPGNPTIDLPR